MLLSLRKNGLDSFLKEVRVLKVSKEPQKRRTTYASWGPIVWSFLRRSARAPTIEAVRGEAARHIRRLKGPSVPVTGGPFPLQGHRFL